MDTGWWVVTNGQLRCNCCQMDCWCGMLTNKFVTTCIQMHLPL